MVDKDRVQRLLKGGAATQKQMDDINASLNVIEKQISSIRAQYVVLDAQVTTFDRQVAQLNNSISDSRIINPFNGTILTKYAEPDEVATYGKPLYTMADLTYLDLRVYVEGTQLPYIKLGQTVEVRYDKDKKSDFKTTGTVTWISETAEFTPKTIQTKEERVNLVYAVKVRVKNDGALKIGMPGEIKFMPEK
jgi:HlyD family secretion protein